ncbi:helix-turn-helix domain-containing protein [Bacillus cereus]|nr:helix-turn-helix domain-containing protein [Bacillus cereus]
MTIGSRVKQIRLTLGMSQQTFADSIGISKPMVSFIESDSKTPSRETVTKIAKLGNTTTDYIIGSGSSSELISELQPYLSKLETFDDETRKFAIKKIKQLINGLDIT